MQHQGNRRTSISGHVYCVERAKGAMWYWRLRLPEGAEHAEERKPIGPAWTGRGRPPEGHFTRKTAEAALEAKLTDLRRGIGIRSRSTATFREIAEAWHEYGSAPRPAGKGWKPATRRDYRSLLDVHLLRAFGDWKAEDVTRPAITRWLTEQSAAKPAKAGKVSRAKLPPRTAHKALVVLHAIYDRAKDEYGIVENPVDGIERRPPRYDAASYDFYSIEEVWALVRAAAASEPDDTPAQVAANEQDSILFLVAALEGLRLGELLGLHWRDVDFTAEAIRVLASIDIIEGLGTPKSGHGRTVPMVADVATALARLAQRDHFTGPDDFVFVGETGGHLDGSALRRRYKAAQTAAKIRKLRLHDLRHTFGSLAVNQVSTVELQAYLGHADARTTARYLHYKHRADEARRLSAAFTVAPPALAEQAAESV